jgi:hypothetical protein
LLFEWLVTVQNIPDFEFGTGIPRMFQGSSASDWVAGWGLKMGDAGRRYDSWLRIYNKTFRYHQNHQNLEKHIDFRSSFRVAKNSPEVVLNMLAPPSNLGILILA